MPGNLLALGTVPAQEACARPSESDYAARAFAQDFDPYLEVVVSFARLRARGGVESALSLYLNFINLFLFLLRVQGGRRT